MQTIYKYPLEITDRQSVWMPARAKLLTVQMQHGVLCLWAEVDTMNPDEEIAIAVYGTGNPCAGGQYIGTAQDGPLVWHVYRVAKEA